MPDGDSIAQVAVVVLLLVLSVPTLMTAHDYSGTPLDYEESLTVDYANDSAVSENATVEGYGDESTIVVDGTALVRGTDYRWNATSGEIDWQDTANTTDGDSAQIEYQAYQRTTESSTAWSIIAPFMGLFGLFALLSSVRALWQLTAEVWEL